MSHLMKIYAVCKFSYFRLWSLKRVKCCDSVIKSCCCGYRNQKNICRFTNCHKSINKTLMLNVVLVVEGHYKDCC